MKWLPLPGLVDWIGEDLLARIDSKRRHSGELKRRRKLGTVELLWLMLAVALDTGKNGLHDILRLATAELDIDREVSIGGFCKARKRFFPPAPTLSSRAVGPGAIPSAGLQPQPMERPHCQGR